MVYWQEDADEDRSAARYQVGCKVWAIAPGRSQAAKSLGLRGWVRNRADGSVELLATGPTECVASMIEACWNGPPAARVDRVELVEAPDDRQHRLRRAPGPIGGRSGGFGFVPILGPGRPGILALGQGIAVDQLDHRHRRVVAVAKARP